MSIPVSCVVLAGGRSVRMGVDKAFLDLLGRPLIEWTLLALESLGTEILLVANAPERYAYLGLRCVTDVMPGSGALGGLYSGLYHMREELGLVVACDMPFLNRRLLEYQVSVTEGYDVTVPRLGRYIEPLHAVYSRRCLPIIADALKEGRKRFSDVLSVLRVRYVEQEEIERFDPGHRSFMNVNTLVDLDVVRRLAAQVWENPDSPTAR